tara:strand:- start:67695 stop:68492 length:798 start_codon:yes stop_codon:yes gene_type:complete
LDYSNIISKTLIKAQKTIKERYFVGNHSELDKNAFGDIQYDIDVLAEETIIQEIKKDLPKATIISEETGISKGDMDLLVLIDPLDGSLNSVRQIPIFSSTISIAKGTKFSDIIASGVIDIINGDLYLGDSNKATINNTTIKPNTVEKLKDALIAVDLNIRIENATKAYQKMMKIFEISKAQRILGSAIMENVYVASGAIDAFIAPSKQLRTFDCLPAIHIGKQSGLFIKFLNEMNDFNLLSKEGVSYVSACTEKLGNNILNELEY